MFKGHQNSHGHLKGSQSLPSLFTPKMSYSKFHHKTNKLVTALYMVTDIMDRDEPLRIRLRSKGTEIVSDMFADPVVTDIKIEEILSFLTIAGTLGMISEMNHGILRKEFMDLKNSLLEHKRGATIWGEGQSLEDFIKEEPAVENSVSQNKAFVSIGHKGHGSIGVQRGSTLMKALSDKIPSMSDRSTLSFRDGGETKKERREEILKVVKDKSVSSGTDFNGLTITDIRMLSPKLSSMGGEKTIQRELVSMVEEGVLKKSGEKRWSRYSPSETPRTL